MKSIIVLSLLAGAMCLASCESFDSINDNPNSSAQVSPQLILPYICQNAFTRGQGGMYADRMVIQTDGHSTEQYYEWTRGSFNIYDGPLLQLEKFKEEADRTGAKAYDGLYKFFHAYYFYQLTLRFGDIPYTEALQGQSNENFTPKYDTQEAVFSGILQDLTDADKELSENSDAIDGDIIYNGDLSKWRKLANSFHLKVLMTLSHKSKVGNHDIKQEFATVAKLPLMESNADNGQLVYIDQQDNRYPQFNAQWSNYYMDGTYIDRMAQRKDPRLFLFCLRTTVASQSGKAVDDFTAYNGGNPIGNQGDNTTLVSTGNISQINSRFRTEPVGEPTMLMGYAELQQVLAEAVVRGWLSGDAKQYYDNGVKASFLFYQTYAPAYAQYVTPAKADEYLKGSLVRLDNSLTAEQKIERIIFQKYCVSFYQGDWDPFFEHLRTGYPEFAHLEASPVPYRWMYPDTEYKYNTKNVEEAITRQFGANNDKITAEPWWLKD